MQSNKNQIIKHNSSISLKTTKKEIETSIFMNNDAVCYLSRSISQNLKTLRAKNTRIQINFLKIIHNLVSILQKNRLTNPFSWTVTISITFPMKNIKYWKINSKSIRLRIKILINNNFRLNKQKQHKKNKTMDYHAQDLELWEFLYLLG